MNSNPISIVVLVMAISCSSGQSGAPTSDWSATDGAVADDSSPAGQGTDGSSSRHGSSGGASGGGGSSGSSGSGGGSSGGSGSGGAGGNADGGSSGAGPGDLDSARDQCVAALNRYRAMKGLAPLMRWTAQEACADHQSMLDAHEYVQNPSGWFHNNYGMCGEHGQCACWPGGDLAQVLVVCSGWYWNEGPGGSHYDNMMNPNFTKVACGFSDNGPGGWWSDQDFQ